MTALPPPLNLEPTQDERTLATLAQALSILGFLAPLIIFLIKRQSRFVSFHALQAVLWHVAYLVLMMVVMVFFVVGFMLTMVTAASRSGHPEPPVAMFFVFPVVWLGFFAGGITNLVLAVVYAVKAGQGEWANYPLFGKWARNILKMGPVGAG